MPINLRWRNKLPENQFLRDELAYYKREARILEKRLQRAEIEIDRLEYFLRDKNLDSCVKVINKTYRIIND